MLAALAFAKLDWVPPQVWAVQFQQVESSRNHCPSLVSEKAASPHCCLTASRGNKRSNAIPKRVRKMLAALAFAKLDWVPPQVWAVQFQQVETSRITALR
jgi:hypothetical protein